jgi:2-dehydropantoate 2-reductase
MAFIGCGPVGGILGAHLLQAGHDVTAIDICKEHLDAMLEMGLVIEGVRSFTAPVEKVFYSVQEALASGTKFDIVFVCVKAPVIQHVIDAVPDLLTPDGTGASMQNGLDTERLLVEKLGPERALRGVINYAGNVTAMGVIDMTFFNPPNFVGAAVAGTAAAEERARRVAELLSGADLATEFSDNVIQHVWQKVIRNAGLMPVSALNGQNMAQVMASAPSLFLVERLLEESLAVAEKLGYSFPADFFDSTLTYYRNAGHHMPSMWIDIQQGLHTEISVLNGAIADYGDQQGVPTPYSRALANLVAGIDELAAIRRREGKQQD